MFEALRKGHRPLLSFFQSAKNLFEALLATCIDDPRGQSWRLLSGRLFGQIWRIRRPKRSIRVRSSSPSTTRQGSSLEMGQTSDAQNHQKGESLATAPPTSLPPPDVDLPSAFAGNLARSHAQLCGQERSRLASWH